MFFEFISFISYLILLISGYLLPLVLASQAYIKNDKNKMNRWLVHFFLIGVLQHSLFPINEYLGCGSIFNGALSVLVLVLPATGYHTVLIGKSESIGNQVLIPQIERVRGLVQTGLQQLNLY